VAAGAWGVIEALPRIVKPGESKKGLEMGILGPVHHSTISITPRVEGPHSACTLLFINSLTRYGL